MKTDIKYIFDIQSLAGNIVTARSTSDLCTVLVGAKCQLMIKSSEGINIRVLILIDPVYCIHT